MKAIPDSQSEETEESLTWLEYRAFVETLVNSSPPILRINHLIS